MFYKEFKPIEALREYVQCIWVLENRQFDDAVNNIFPDGCMELIFHYGHPFKRITGDESAVQQRSLLVGQINQPLRLQATGNAGVIGVRFYPWGLYSLVNMPLQLLTNSETHIDNIWGKEAANLEDKIHNCDRSNAMMEIQRFLVQQIKTPSYQVGRLKKVVDMVMMQQGNVRIDELAYQSNLSVRQFTRNFTHLVGLPPKTFAGIVRFQSFFKQCNLQENVHLGELAQRCGYYDQAHFIREFKQYTSMNPGAYFKNEQQLATLFLLK